MSDIFDYKSYTVPIFNTVGIVRNFTTVKKYGNNYLKLCTMKAQRNPHTELSDKDYTNWQRSFDNWEHENNCYWIKDPWGECMLKVYYEDEWERLELEALKRYERQNKSNSKLVESLIRSKRNVFEYAFSNDWDYFATFTINKNKFDRYNLNAYHTAFSHWLRNYFRRKFNDNVQYLCIPEMHKDGAWHEHALIKGISKQHFKLFDINDKLPHYIRKKLLSGGEIYNCPAYAKKFGFCTFEPVRNAEACAKYITKYITKDMFNSVNVFGAKVYYASRGIKKAEVLKRGYYQGNYIQDFSNDYCRQATFAYSDDFAQTVLSKFYEGEK